MKPEEILKYSDSDVKLAFDRCCLAYSGNGYGDSPVLPHIKQSSELIANSLSALSSRGWLGMGMSGTFICPFSSLEELDVRLSMMGY